MAIPPAGGAPDESFCPRCGSPVEPGQEYCLECGLRLGGGRGLVGMLANAWRERFRWYPGDWIWPVLLGLMIAVAGGVAAVLIGSGSGNGSPLVATHPGEAREPVTPPPTATVALPSVPSGTPTSTGPPATPAKPPPATTASPPPGTLIAWPANRNGWTVVLESVPNSAGRSVAVARARAAARAGLAQVGVLDSSGYSSLHPGYYVVFSGVFASKSQADSAARAAGGKGFPRAYSRQITR